MLSTALILNNARSKGKIIVSENIVYATSDSSHEEPFFTTYEGNDWSQISYSNGSFTVRERDGYSMNNHPVLSVSWYGITAFCDYYGYRLPTKTEWMGFADYDGTYLYGCGLAIDWSMANYQSSNPLGLTSEPYTTPVGYYGSYGYGLCDAAGNVAEWTSSLINNYTGTRLVLGGSWKDHQYSCKCSYLAGSRSLTNMNNYFGFRVCR